MKRRKKKVGDFYGRSHLFALKSEQGFLCYNWFGAHYVGVVLFSDTKTAQAWLKAVAKLGYELEVQPTAVKEHPPALKPTINPSMETGDITRIMMRRVWQNW